MDATMYGEKGGVLVINNMPEPITLALERMRKKDPELVLIPGTPLAFQHCVLLHLIQIR